MKSQGLTVESGFKHAVSDFFRSKGEQQETREKLAKAGIDVEALVSGMKATSGQKVSLASAMSTGKAQQKTKGASAGIGS